MKTELIRGLDNLKPRHQGCVAAIGNFDGVHRGHQALLSRLKEHSQNLGVPAMVMTFEPQPLEFFARGQTPPRLTRWREKFCFLAEKGLERVLVVHFNAAFAALNANVFIDTILFERLGAKHVMVGDDFKFGQGREGNVTLLTQRGHTLGFTVEVMPNVMLAGERISSTRVRQALAMGDHRLAEQLLGHPYCMLGRVVYGNQLGRQLGFPTANIYLHREVSPVLGIYAVRLQDENKQSWPGVAYVGTRPTVQGTRTVLEVHLFDFAQNLYGQQVSVEFCKKLRDDKHFDNLELLKQQIAIDTEQARNYFYD